MENAAAYSANKHGAWETYVVSRASSVRDVRKASIHHSANDSGDHLGRQRVYEVVETEGRPATCLVWFD